MSALGDYVHLNAINYDKYGTARNEDGSKFQSPETSLNAQKTMLQNRIDILKAKQPSAAAIEELKNRIKNESVQNQARKIAENKSMVAASEERIAKEFLQNLMMQVPKRLNQGSSAKMSIMEQQGNPMLSYSDINLNKAKQIRKRIMSYLSQINKTGKVSDTAIKTLNANFTEFFKTLGVIVNNLDLKCGNLEEAGTRAALIDILNLVSLADVNKSTLHGVFGEAVTNMVTDSLLNKAEAAVEEAIIKSIKTGEHRSKFQLTNKKISEDVQKSFQYKTKYNLYQAHATQDKVDASITVLGENIDASVKAYTQKDGAKTTTAHLQTINLIYSLSTTAGQFANHWLNLHALSLGRSKFRGYKTEFDKELTKQIQYEALSSGNLLKKKAVPADTFVAIDPDKGKVYVQTASDILEKHSSFFSISPKISSINLPNSRQATWENRIANMLIALHKKKISVGLKIYYED